MFEKKTQLECHYKV